MQKSLLTLILAAICSITVKSQVTIGSSENPAAGALLQLKEISGVSDDSPDAYGGLAMPRVNLTEVDKLYPMFLSDKTNVASGPDASYAGAAYKATLDKSHTGLLVYNTNGTPPFKKGIYVWTGVRWEPTGSSASAIAENGLTANGNMILLGGALTQPTTVTLGANNLNFDATGDGKVGIGNAPSSNSAILEVNADDKGVLLPKVALASTKDATTISNPAVGLLVYNTGTHASYKREGYMFWNGTEWRTIDNEPAVAPVISQLFCGSASLSPSSYDQGVPYTGIMRVPYSGGNGAKYTTGQAVIANGLTFQLQDGKLENGNGDLVFKVTGTPSASSPVSTSVSMSSATIPFYTGSCSAVVGDQIRSEMLTVAVLSPLKATTDNNVAGWATAITTPDGKFSVRVFVPNSTNMEDADLQIRNNDISNNVTIMWSSTYAWYNASSGASSNTLTLSPRVWSGNSGDYDPTTVQITNNNYKNNTAWGNENVYFNNAPEQRSYMWTTKNTSDQTAYMMTFMMGSTSTGAVDASKAANTKAFFKIDQIRAQ